MSAEIDRALKDYYERRGLVGTSPAYEAATMAAGCCSAYPDAFGRPCSHQRNDPTTICDVCKAAQEIINSRKE